MKSNNSKRKTAKSKANPAFPYTKTNKTTVNILMAKYHFIKSHLFFISILTQEELQMNNDVVMMNLDRPREIRFGHKALKKVVAMTGKTLEEIENNGFSDFEIVEKMAYCGLLEDAQENGETLKLEDMEDLLDKAPNWAHVAESINRAFMVAFGVDINSVNEGNGQSPEYPANENRLTGKKASE